MKTLHFSIAIHAPKDKVWRAMLDREGYKIWTAEFAKDSYYEGSWAKGEKIKFLAPDGNGLTSVIAENRPFEFVSIKHLGYIKDGIEDTESPDIKAWAPLFENYTFSENNGVTEVQVDMDVTPEFAECMEQTWPKALAKLKLICE
ncbi:MAG: SRPBCC domain-containing protein [Acaryochloridaceae cyanobacterium RU_4_10]|nr:SRPBCC domain-containing protein [Acaryochloridaceae cyanobacterium RU_4_10]